MGFEGYCVDTWQRVRAELASDAVLSGLRDYQLTGLADLQIGFRSKDLGGLGLRHQVRVLPTGGGKTVEAAGVVHRTRKKGNQAVMLVHTREIFDQTIQTVNAVVPGGERRGCVRADLPEPAGDADLFVAMVKTLEVREDCQRWLPASPGASDHRRSAPQCGCHVVGDHPPGSRTPAGWG